MNEILLKDQASELIEAIYAFRDEYAKDLNSLDTILEFCYRYDLDIQGVGELLAEHSEYVKLLEQELVREKYSRNFVHTEQIDENEW